jgi:DNA-binding NarL/FixJ family response regulator
MKKAEKMLGLLEKETAKTRSGTETYEKLKPKELMLPFRQPPAEDNIYIEPEQKKSLKDEVLSLYNMGIASDMIAKKLNRTEGEVELIISLGKKRG